MLFNCVRHRLSKNPFPLSVAFVVFRLARFGIFAVDSMWQVYVRMLVYRYVVIPANPT